MHTMLMVAGWVAWVATCGLAAWFAVGTRRQVQRGFVPFWSTQCLTLWLLLLAVLFLWLPMHKAHLLWVLPLIWVLGFPIASRVGFFYVPVLSKVLIWPAYLYSGL